GKAIGLLLFAAQPLFGLYPLDAGSFGLRLLAGKYLFLVLGNELFDAEEQHYYRGKRICACLYPYIRHHRSVRTDADYAVNYTRSQRHCRNKYGAVHRHAETIATETILCLDMVEAVGEHGEYHVARGCRAKTF